MTIGMSDIAATLVLAGISALAWRRRQNVGGKTWAFRVIPPGLILLLLTPLRPNACWLAALLAAYAIAAHLGGWRFTTPGNRVLRAIWWATHVVVYFATGLIICAALSGGVKAVVMFSPIATEGDWPWTRGNIADELPFAVEYRRAKTFCAEYDKRILFKSGKRVGLPIDPCGFGPFRVYKLKTGEYCLVDGFDMKLPKSFGDQSRHMRVNVENETVELKSGNGWFKIPEKGYVCGWGGEPGNLNGFSFDMYSGRDLDGEVWHVDVKGAPVGASLDGMMLLGEIDTRGRFNKIMAAR